MPGNFNNLRDYIVQAQLDRGPDFTQAHQRGKVYNTPTQQMSPSYGAPTRPTNPYESLKGLTGGPLSPKQIDALNAIQRWNEGGADAPNLWDPAFKGYSLVGPTGGSKDWTLERDTPPRPPRKLNPIIDKWDPSDPDMERMLKKKGFGVFDNAPDIFTKENIVEAWKRLTNFK